MRLATRALTTFGLLLLAPALTFADLGVWTSQVRTRSTQSIDVPTTFGASLGLTIQIGAPVLTHSAPDFSPWHVDRFGTQDTDSEFTENSLHLHGYATYETVGQPGNQWVYAYNEILHVQGNFHLDSPSPYSLSGLPEGPFNSGGQFPILHGPGGQTILLNTHQTGVLPAGDWQIVMDLSPFQLANPTNWPRDQRITFLFTVPEPSGILPLAAMMLTLLQSRRRR